MVRKILLSAALALVAHSAHAGLFDDEEARRRIEALRVDLDQRMQRVEVLTRGQQELNNGLESLRQDLARLRGQIEVLANELEQSKKRQQDFYVDLDNRLRKLETVAAQPPKPVEPPPPDAATESRDYETAVNLLRANRHVDAAVAFKNFIRTYPRSNFQASAHFWAASSYARARDFESAREFYSKVMSTWPDDPLAPDAMLGLADVQQEAGDRKASQDTLTALAAKYPNSEAAKTARARLPKKR